MDINAANEAIDAYLLWLSARPFEVRKASGFVDC